jgi:hypothetical protein
MQQKKEWDLSGNVILNRTKGTDWMYIEEYKPHQSDHLTYQEL